MALVLRLIGRSIGMGLAVEGGKSEVRGTPETLLEGHNPKVLNFLRRFL